MAEKTTIKQRPHQYTVSERLNLGTRINETMDELDKLERDKKQAMAEFKSQIGDANSILAELRNNHKNGFEMRDHECVARPDKENGVMDFVDIATGEVIESRPFTSEDWSQAVLFADEEGPDETAIRAHAAVIHGEGPQNDLWPNLTQQGNYTTGPETDAFIAAASTEQLDALITGCNRIIETNGEHPEVIEAASLVIEQAQARLVELITSPAPTTEAATEDGAAAAAPEGEAPEGATPAGEQDSTEGPDAGSAPEGEAPEEAPEPKPKKPKGGKKK